MIQKNTPLKIKKQKKPMVALGFAVVGDSQ
jgi:hypothetical protein